MRISNLVRRVEDKTVRAYNTARPVVQAASSDVKRRAKANARGFKAAFIAFKEAK